MRLYSGTTEQFIRDNVQNQIAEKLKTAFSGYYRYNPGPAEVSSWRNSLRAMSQVVEHAGLLDHGIMLEYQLPLTSKRLDCMLCGRDDTGSDQAVIVELKQWEGCEPSETENTVRTWVGQGKREVLHPSVQVKQYATYLQDFHTAFYEPPAPICLNACSYLHNHNRISGDYLFDPSFSQTLKSYPLYTADQAPELMSYLNRRLGSGEGLEVLARIEKGNYRPSKKLMDHVGNIIRGKTEYTLLDEQLVVYERVLQCARAGMDTPEKRVVIIRGGPGTGKSVIAINLMADLSLKGFNAQYATGSRAFTGTLKKVIGPRGGVQFRYFNSYGTAENNSVDVLISDEAHRIRETSNSRFTPASKRSGKAQIDELLDASKVSVFFIDNDQVVRPGEVGSSELIKEHSEKRGCSLYEYELEAQFRCAGSDGFVNWVNNTLGIKKTANILWQGNEAFDFQIIDSPQKLEETIREKIKEGYTGRVTAGFCWDWSKPKEDGTLVDDVVIGEYKRPWDAKPEAKHLAKGIPPATLWAYDPNGINQVGCVYTAQGFEFDYVGVIFGKDLTYDLDQRTWLGHPEESSDNVVKRSKGMFVDLVKNTYRVLLSRGLKGCYVYFMDKDTERFVKSRIEEGE